MFNNKKNTFEQHDNETINYYRHSINNYSTYCKLENNISVDVCVIGGGLTGVTSALNLAKKGLTKGPGGYGDRGNVRGGDQRNFGEPDDEEWFKSMMGS